MKLVLSLVLATGALFAQQLAPCLSPAQQSCQAPSLDQGVVASSQVPGSPNYGSAFAWVIPASVQLTTPEYWASQPPAIQALQHLAGLPGAFVQGQNPASMTPQYKQALALATQGYCVDVWIMALGNDPVVTMLLRTEDNIPSTPCGLGPGSIKTSLSPADYPAFPLPPPPPVSTVMVGQQMSNPNMGTYYSDTPYSLGLASTGKLTNGFAFAESGVSYVTHLSFGLMGITLYFTLAQ